MLFYGNFFQQSRILFFVNILFLLTSVEKKLTHRSQCTLRKTEAFIYKLLRQFRLKLNCLHHYPASR